MFESNFPVDKAMYSYATVWNAFKRLALTFGDAAARDLLHDTAVRTYRLPMRAAAVEPQRAEAHA